MRISACRCEPALHHAGPVWVCTIWAGACGATQLVSTSSVYEPWVTTKVFLATRCRLITAMPCPVGQPEPTWWPLGATAKGGHGGLGRPPRGGTIPPQVRMAPAEWHGGTRTSITSPPRKRRRKFLVEAMVGSVSRGYRWSCVWAGNNAACGSSGSFWGEGRGGAARRTGLAASQQDIARCRLRL